MLLTFIIGMAGSGKSLLTQALTQYLLDREQSVISVNLDPGAMTLPYSADIDVRDEVNVTDIMDRFGLGPNGALVMAADIIASKVDKLREDIEETKAEYAVVDTPGQMELFAFRQSGPFIAKAISNGAKTVIYLFDAPFSIDPFNYVSNLFISAALYSRFLMPQIQALTKTDMVEPEKLEMVTSWSEEEGWLEAAIEKQLTGETYLLSRDILSAVAQLGTTTQLIPVSAMTGQGLVDLVAALTRILTGGEEVLE